MFQMEVDGLTGIIKFDEDGFRSDVEIDVLEVMSYGLEKVCLIENNINCIIKH